jgi:hypothetical protein
MQLGARGHVNNQNGYERSVIEKITEFIPMMWIMLQIHYTTHIFGNIITCIGQWFRRSIILIFNLRNERMNVCTMFYLRNATVALYSQETNNGIFVFPSKS